MQHMNYDTEDDGESIPEKMATRFADRPGTGRRTGGMTAVLTLVMALLAASPGRAGSSPGDPTREARPSGPSGRAVPDFVVERPEGTIEIRGIPPGSALGSLLARTAEQAAGELRGRLGLGLPGRVEVLFCTDAATFARVAGRPGTDRLLGVARNADAIVALNGPLLGLGPEDNAARTLRHELGHLAVGTVEDSGGPIPRWFDEGVASWFAGSFAELGPLDLAPAATRRALSLPRLAFGFPEDLDGRRIAYAKSLMAVELIERRAGPGAIASLGESLAAGMAFPAALLRVSGLDEAGIEDLLQRETAPHGLFVAVLRRSLSPFLVMTGLAVVGFVVRRIRARRRLKQWEREEERESEGGEGEG